MKNIQILFLVVGTAFMVSCNQPKTTSKTDAEVEVKEASAEATDTIVGRGCFEIVSDIPYDIPAQRFDETMQTLAHASGCFIETDLSVTGSIPVNAIQGKMSIRDAILVAIEGTNLKITEETDDRIKVEFVE